jgi:hypothetical protein
MEVSNSRAVRPLRGFKPRCHSRWLIFQCGERRSRAPVPHWTPTCFRNRARSLSGSLSRRGRRNRTAARRLTPFPAGARNPPGSSSLIFPLGTLLCQPRSAFHGCFLLTQALILILARSTATFRCHLSFPKKALGVSAFLVRCLQRFTSLPHSSQTLAGLYPRPLTGRRDFAPMKTKIMIITKTASQNITNL